MKIIFLILFIFFSLFPLQASEVIEQTQTQVVVRDHGKTRKPYVSITSAYADPSMNPVAGGYQPKSRPDYRMLDHHLKSATIPYDGPTSDRKKVYILAATLAAGGVLGGTLAPIAPAAATAGSGSGAALYAVGGTAVAAGTVSTALIQSHPDPHKDDYDHKSESKEIFRPAEIGDRLG